ncbi:MAG: hypothetical protein OXL38_15005 [Gammaproteobacteria bacterium]|nr:hypothetical protein [Gammaproteobacteria bacterium]
MYSFLTTKPIDGITTTIQIVYPDHGHGEDHLATGIEQIIEGYNRRLVPSRLLFVCPQPMMTKIQECLAGQRQRFEDRLRSTSHVMLAPYDHRGLLVAEQIVHLSAGTPWDVDDKFLVDVARHGVSELFKGTETILRAPHGYAFRKPSGREEDIFIRAGNMLREPSALPIFNYLLLRRLPPNCSIVYIDSFTILSFAMGLQSIAAYFQQSNCPLPALAIESTHSYDITHEVWIPNEQDYLVLISASTSGGLAQKLIDEYQVDRARIVHLLGVGSPSALFRDSCIYFEPRDPAKSANSNQQTNAAIEIRTEEFLVSQGQPRPVRITKSHVDVNGASQLHEPFYDQVLRFGHPPVSNANRTYSYFSVTNEIDGGVASPLHAWTTERLVHELPASTSTLVYVDETAKRVAEWAGEKLGPHVVTTHLERLDQCHNSATSTIVVFAYDDPDLEQLARASIALRAFPNANRHYVVCYGFPSSRVEHERRRSDRQMRARGPRYGWSEFLVLPVGPTVVHESLMAYRKLLEPVALRSNSDILGKKLVDVLSSQGQSHPVCSKSLFLPRTCGDPLVLREGSVFLPHSSDTGVSQIAVYAMVSAALQAAREPLGQSADQAPGFDDNPFVRSVLDPSMFARYSDGILQASLLRAAQCSELDYSASEELSGQFAATCASVLANHGNSVGDAAIEFVYALATEKVCLSDPDHKRLHEAIASVPILRSLWQLFRADDPIAEHLGPSSHGVSSSDALRSGQKVIKDG